MAHVIAFRASGRLKVSVSTGPSRVMSASLVSTSSLLGSGAGEYHLIRPCS